MASSTQNHVDPKGPRQHSKAGIADSINTNDKDEITSDSAPTSDHTSRSDSDQKDMKKDAQKPGKTDNPPTTPKRSKKKVAFVMTALAARDAKLNIEIERASIANMFSS